MRSTGPRGSFLAVLKMVTPFGCAAGHADAADGNRITWRHPNQHDLVALLTGRSQSSTNLGCLGGVGGRDALAAAARDAETRRLTSACRSPFSLTVK